MDNKKSKRLIIPLDYRKHFPESQKVNYLLYLILESAFFKRYPLRKNQEGLAPTYIQPVTSTEYWLKQLNKNQFKFVMLARKMFNKEKN